jgi:hypothetical protein
VVIVLSIIFALATELFPSSLAPIASAAISAAVSVLSWISEPSIDPCCILSHINHALPSITVVPSTLNPHSALTEPAV